MIYFVKCGTFVKIGVAEDAKTRLSGLQCANPFDLELLGVVPGDMWTEDRLHRRFRTDHHRGDWFHLSDRLEAFIREYAVDYLTFKAAHKLQMTSVEAATYTTINAHHHCSFLEKETRKKHRKLGTFTKYYTERAHY